MHMQAQARQIDQERGFSPANTAAKALASYGCRLDAGRLSIYAVVHMHPKGMYMYVYIVYVHFVMYVYMTSLFKLIKHESKPS